MAGWPQGRLAFPSVGTPYRGFIGEVRGWFNRISDFYGRQPGSKADLTGHITVLLNSIDATKAVVSNTQQLTVPVTGTYATKATLTVVAGAVTAIVLS
jgi:hypothetical protein